MTTTRHLGGTGLAVAPIGLGCMSMSSGYGPPGDRVAMRTLLRHAVDHGVTLFDTALVYGPFVNESLVGEALAPLRQIVHGSGDPIPIESAREWAASIPGSRLIVLEGAGHFPMVDRPKAMLDAIESFFFPAGR